MTLAQEALKHIFEIDIDVWSAISFDEITATVEAMHELGIYKLPFDEGEIVLRIRHHDDHNPNGYHQVTEARGLREGENFCEEILMYPKQAKGHAGLKRFKNFALRLKNEGKSIVKLTEPDSETVDCGIHLDGKRVVHRSRCFHHSGPIASQKLHRDALIVILASKGTVKCVGKNKRSALGIGKRKTNEYVTTIKLDANLERHESVGSSRPTRPHLRRGHIRSQHYGQGNQLLKKIWIEPCFVNADADFVSARKAYRVIH